MAKSNELSPSSTTTINESGVPMLHSLPTETEQIVSAFARSPSSTTTVSINVIAWMREGCTMLKQGQHAKPKFRWFELSSDNLWLQWYSDQKTIRQSRIFIPTIVKIRYGVESDTRQINVQMCALTIDYIQNKKAASLSVICKQTQDAKLWYDGLSYLLKLCQNGQNVTTINRLDVLVEKQKPMDSAMVLLTMKELALNKQILKLKSTDNQSSFSSTSFGFSISPFSDVYLSRKRHEKKYWNLLQVQKLLRREWNSCIDQMIAYRKNPMMNQNRAVLSRANAVMQGLDKRLTDIKHELKDYNLQYINPLLNDEENIDEGQENMEEKNYNIDDDDDGDGNGEVDADADADTDGNDNGNDNNNHHNNHFNTLKTTQSRSNSTVNGKEKLMTSIEDTTNIWDMQCIDEEANTIIDEATPKTPISPITSINGSKSRINNLQKINTKRPLEPHTNNVIVYESDKLIEDKREKESERNLLVMKNRYQVLADIHIELISILVDLYAWKAKIQKIISEPYMFQ